MAPSRVPVTATWAAATGAPPSESVMRPRMVPVPVDCADSPVGTARLPTRSSGVSLPNDDLTSNLANDNDTGYLLRAGGVTRACDPSGVGPWACRSGGQDTLGRRDAGWRTRAEAS